MINPSILFKIFFCFGFIRDVLCVLMFLSHLTLSDGRLIPIDLYRYQISPAPLNAWLVVSDLHTTSSTSFYSRRC